MATPEFPPGCPDCTAQPHASQGVSVSGAPVLIVVVTHDESCPWARRYLSTEEPSVVATERGVLIHVSGELS